MPISKVTINKATLNRLDLIREAESELLKLRPPGYEIAPNDYRAICDAMNAGMSPEEAAARIHATIAPTVKRP